MKIVSLVECEPLYLYIGFYLLYLLMFTTLENQTSFTIVAVMWKRKKLSVSMLMPFFVLFFSASFDLRWKSTKSEICGTWLLALLFRSSSLNSKSVQKEGGSTHHFHTTSSHQKRGLQQNSDFYTKLFALKQSFWHFGIHSNMNRFHYSAISEWLHKVGKLGQFKKILKPEKVHDI